MVSLPCLLFVILNPFIPCYFQIQGQWVNLLSTYRLTSFWIHVTQLIDQWIWKGGPRTTLYDVCKKLQWPVPAFDSREYKDRWVRQLICTFNCLSNFNLKRFFYYVVLHEGFVCVICGEQNWSLNFRDWNQLT